MGFHLSTVDQNRRPAPATAGLPKVTIQDRVAAVLPGLIAVSDGETSLTYGQLRERADRVADALRSRGVVPGSLVGLCLPRSVALVTASLGILRAGAAYVALDPAQPRLRLGALSADSGVALVIAGADTSELPSAWSIAQALPDVGLLYQVEMTKTPVIEPGLAYVIYTSGSTGEPNGVMVEQSGLINLARWHRAAFGIGPGQRCSQIGGPGFDAAAWETWGCLAAGGSLIIPAEKLKTDPAQLRDWLVAEDIAVSFLPTPLAEAVLALEWPAASSLRVLLTGGDRLHRAPPAGLGFDVVNNYGLTEATVVSTSGIVAPASVDTPSIGRPIDAVTIRVVDAAMNDVPVGQAGELLVGGISLARGYLRAPDLTARRFVTLAAPDGSPSRWYRTGDLVKVRGDGEIDYLSRVDEQVQIRGNRVEPGEIVVALDRHPGVAQSVVLAVDGATGPRLVAFLQPADRLETDDAALRDHLAQWLPAHMHPSTFVWLDTMPLTNNGKIDRQLLAASSEPAAARPIDHSESGDELVTTIADLVGGLLGLALVRSDENFLLLGGHSLLGAQLVTRLADRFGVEVSLRDLFDHPTPAGLAGLVRDQLVAQVLALDDETAARLAGPLTSAE